MVSSRTPSLRDSTGELIRRRFVVELGLVVAVVVGFFAATIALDAVLDPHFLDSDVTLLVLRSVLVLTGLGVLAASYASWRGYSLPASLPDRSEGRLIGAATAGTVVLATLPFALLALRTNVGVDHVASAVVGTDGVFAARVLVRASLFVAGMVLLYHALVQGALQQVFGGDRTLAVVVTTLLGGYLVTPTVPTYGTFANGPWLFLWGERAAVAVVFVLALWVAVYADERVDDSLVRALSRAPAAAALALATFVLAVEAGSSYGAVVAVTRAATVGVAAVAYDGTESLVAPALVYATFAAVSTVLYSATVAAVLGA